MNNKMLNLKAYCTGKSYPFPTDMLVYDKSMGLSVGARGISLGSWYFRTKKEYQAAKKMVRFYIKKGLKK